MMKTYGRDLIKAGIFKLMWTVFVIMGGATNLPLLLIPAPHMIVKAKCGFPLCSCPVPTHPPTRACTHPANRLPALPPPPPPTLPSVCLSLQPTSSPAPS